MRKVCTPFSILLKLILNSACANFMQSSTCSWHYRCHAFKIKCVASARRKFYRFTTKLTVSVAEVNRKKVMSVKSALNREVRLSVPVIEIPFANSSTDSDYFFAFFKLKAAKDIKGAVRKWRQHVSQAAPAPHWSTHVHLLLFSSSLSSKGTLT